MDKLVERETATRNPLVAAPALAVQFFLIPLAVVGMAVLLYSGFRSLLADDRTPQDYLAEVRSGGSNRRWPAAYELSRLMGDAKVRADRTLAPALVAAYDEAKDDDPRIRQYLALAIGRLDPPLPADAVASLTSALEDPDSEARITAIWALGSSSDPQVAATLQPLYESSDKGIRKMVVYALGALPGDTQIKTLQTALQDSEADVRWNAAVALARHDSRDGVPVLKQMLDRAYVEQAVKRGCGPERRPRPGGRCHDQWSSCGCRAERRPVARVGRRAESAGSQHESAPGGARSTQGDGDRVELSRVGAAMPHGPYTPRGESWTSMADETNSPGPTPVATPPASPAPAASAAATPTRLPQPADRLATRRPPRLPAPAQLPTAGRAPPNPRRPTTAGRAAA